MAYHIYTTDAVVLGSYEQGESNRTLDLLTRDFGRLRAVARGMREEKSKLRYALQTGMLTSVSLVRGKEVWRVTGAENGIFSAPTGEAGDAAKRVLRLVRILYHGEAPNQECFDALASLARFLAFDADAETAGSAEIATVLRMLHSLGYIGEHAALRGVITHTALDPESLALVASAKREALGAINSALRESNF